MTAHIELIEFVLSHVDELPPPKRARIYGALAEISGDPAERDHLQEISDAINATEALCHDFNFSFRLKTSAQPSKP